MTANNEEKCMPVSGHLQELRRRLAVSAAVIAGGAVAAYGYMGDLLHILAAPVGKLYFFSPTEVFFTNLELAVIVSVIGTLPFLIYQVWAFFAPALTPPVRRIAKRLLPFSVLLFYSGLAFAYVLVLPTAVRFLLSFSGSSVQSMLSLSAYISFVISFVLPFGLAFELPLVILLLAAMGIVTEQGLCKKRRYMIVGAFIFGGVVSPTTDMFTQTMIAVPMILLYEISIFSVRILFGK